MKALAQAHRWKRMLETGELATAKELAAVKINPSYLGRVLGLTLLAPDQRILDGMQPPALELEQLSDPSRRSGLSSEGAAGSQSEPPPSRLTPLC